MGITTILAPNNSFPEYASVGLHINFGSADETPAQRGQAHLLEHLLVRSHFPRSLALKASTGRERTSFQLVTKVGDINRTIEALARVIHHRIRITPETLVEEKGIVAREIAERHQSMSWRVREAAFNALWEGTSYSYDPLGTVADLMNLGPSSLSRTLEQQYLPGNAVLVIAGGSRLKDQLVTTGWPNRLPLTKRRATLPQSPRLVRLRWNQEELGHVLAWSDSAAQSRARLVNRMGEAKFQQLALREGWLTWVWVPPSSEPKMTVESQLSATLSALSESKSSVLSEYRCDEIKRCEQVEATAQDAIDRLWAGPGRSAPLSLADGLEHWRSFVQKVRA
ncbi:M16 family metallopeptidase [Corynebacterium cystitidis]|uniref:M16 family metallopeptidase n=1 Tax=Corynebacterium cystitidis TaxID=35757 RepID=UPI00358DC43F